MKPTNKKNAAQKSKHSAKSPDYGTPEYLCDSSRVVFGGPIDLDPCSSPLFNQAVRALKIYTRIDNGLAHPWLGNIQVNPPGEDHGDAVKRFWEHLLSEYAAGRVISAIWIGFNLDQLQHLQQTSASASPFMFPTCIPRKRIPFNMSERDHQASLFGEEEEQKLIPSTRPGHSNFITLLPDRSKPWQVEIFRQEFSKYGVVRI